MQKKSTLYLIGEQFHETGLTVGPEEQSFSFVGLFRTIDPVTITLTGAHQRKNAALALMTLEVLRQYYALVIDDEDLVKGMRHASWPGRMEMITSNPRILLDGAHNPEGAQALAAALKETHPYKKLRLMMGMLANKNHQDTLRHILPLVDTLVVTEPDFRKKMAAPELASLVAEMKGQFEFELIVEPDWELALQRLREATETDDLGVVTGTLYLISDVRARLLNITDTEKGW